MAVLGACDAERILAFVTSGGAGGSSGGAGSGGGSPTDAGGNPGDAMGGRGDAGQGPTFGQPQLVPGLRSDTDDVQDPALFSDGTGLVFASRRLTQGGTADLFSAARSSETAPFLSLVPIAELNTTATEEDPWMSQDGTHILFASDRSGHLRIYEAFRK